NRALPKEVSAMTLRLHLRALLPLPVLVALSVVASAQSVGREELHAQIDWLRKELKQKEAQFLAPSPIDVKKYSQFLGQPHTGLCRLLPREDFDGRLM